MRISCGRCGASLTGDLRPVSEAEVRGIAEVAEGGALVAAGLLAISADVVGADMTPPDEAVGLEGGHLAVANPDDVIGIRLNRNARGGCCGHDGCDGPNVDCDRCGATVALLRTDCWTGAAVYFLWGSAVPAGS